MTVLIQHPAATRNQLIKNQPTQHILLLHIRNHPTKNLRIRSQHTVLPLIRNQRIAHLPIKNRPIKSHRTRNMAHTRNPPTKLMLIPPTKNLRIRNLPHTRNQRTQLLPTKNPRTPSLVPTRIKAILLLPTRSLFTARHRIRNLVAIRRRIIRLHRIKSFQNLLQRTWKVILIGESTIKSPLHTRNTATRISRTSPSTASHRMKIRSWWNRSTRITQCHTKSRPMKLRRRITSCLRPREILCIRPLWSTSSKATLPIYPRSRTSLTCGRRWQLTLKPPAPRVTNRPQLTLPLPMKQQKPTKTSTRATNLTQRPPKKALTLQR